MSSANREVRVKVLFAETRDELRAADAKATAFSGVTGLLIGVVLTGLLAGDWDPRVLSNLVEWLFWLGAAFGLAAEVLFCTAVVPQLRRPGPLMHYFGDVAHLSSAAALKKALEVCDDDYDRYVEQLYVVARIAWSKYRLIRAGVICLTAGIVLATSAVLIDASLR